MKTLLLCLLTCIGCGLTGCATAPERVVVTGSYLPDLPADGPSQTASTNFPRIATRGFLYTQDPTPTGYGAYAYLVFTSDPSRTHKDRHRAMCSAFTDYLPPATRSESAAERKADMVTFWPLTGSDSENEPDCRQLIANYDWRFAARIAADVKKPDVKGPLLVAWTKPFGATNSDALVLDMSTFADDDLARAVRKWKGRISRDPAVWQRGWKATVVREELRNVIENIGPGVVSVVSTFLPKPKSE